MVNLIFLRRVVADKVGNIFSMCSFYVHAIIKAIWMRPEDQEIDNCSEMHSTGTVMAK